VEAGVGMADKRDKKTKLRVIRGGQQFEIWFGSIRIIAAPAYEQPFPIGAVAEEEDTFLVLSADPVVREPKEHPVRLMTRVIETRPEPVGSVLVRGRRPIRLLAIVHDLNQDPSWKEEWIESALNGILREAENRKVQSIAIPLLGTKHGSLGKQRFSKLLRTALERMSPVHLKRIWLVMPDRTTRKTLNMIESELQK